MIFFQKWGFLDINSLDNWLGALEMVLFKKLKELSDIYQIRPSLIKAIKPCIQILCPENHWKWVGQFGTTGGKSFYMSKSNLSRGSGNHLNVFFGCHLHFKNSGQLGRKRLCSVHAHRHHRYICNGKQ